MEIKPEDRLSAAAIKTAGRRVAYRIVRHHSADIAIALHEGINWSQITRYFTIIYDVKLNRDTLYKNYKRHNAPSPETENLDLELEPFEDEFEYNPFEDDLDDEFYEGDFEANPFEIEHTDENEKSLQFYERLHAGVEIKGYDKIRASLLDDEYYGGHKSELFNGISDALWIGSGEKMLSATTAVITEFTESLTKMDNLGNEDMHETGIKMINHMLVLHKAIQKETKKRAKAMVKLTEDRLIFKQQRDLALRELMKERS